MKKFYPHVYFWITALVIILIGEISHIQLSDDFLDINVHDTYFVTAIREVSIVLALLFILAGFMYWTFKKKQIKLFPNLTVIHTIITIGVVYLYHAVFIYYKYFGPKSVLLDTNEYYLNLFLIFSAIIAQLFLIINSIFSLVKHIKSKKAQS